MSKPGRPKKGGYKYIHLAIIENRRQWHELFWAMSQNNNAAYAELKKMNTPEFFSIFKPWRDKMRELAKKNKSKTH